jgi:flagellin-like protein
MRTMDSLARWRHRGRRAVSPIIATIFLLGMTIASGVIIWTYSIKPAPPAPTVYFQTQGGLTYPVWGDPTDCRPVEPHNVNYYLGNGSGDPRWSTYMNDWWTDCENSNVGVYNMMNVSEISVTAVTQPIRLADVQFEFVCHNTTPTVLNTVLVGGSLQAMSWFPGSSQSLPSNAPTLGACGTFNVSQAYPTQANGVYYNRLGFYDPLKLNATLLEPGDAFVLYVHTANSVSEAPSPIERQNTWNQPDVDDYHGAPTWCFSVVGACTIYLVDTGVHPSSVLATIPVTKLA